MNNTILPTLLAKLRRSSNASFRRLELSQYNPAEVTMLVSAGVMVRDGLSQTIRCEDSDCGKTHEVHWLDLGKDQDSIPYYDCPGRERMYFAPEKLHEYRITFGAFADSLALSIGSDTPCRTMGHLDVRRLGTLRLDARPRDAYIIRGDLQSHDADMFSDAIVILIREMIGRLEIPNAAATVLAQECCRLDQDGIRLDVDVIRQVLTGTGPAACSSKYVLRDRGDFWEIAYGGNPILLENTVGLRYIRHLLRNPGTEYSALLLMHGEKHGVRAFSEASVCDQSLTIYDRDGIGLDNYAIMDSPYVRDCVKHLESLRSKLERAKRKDDAKSVTRLNDEITVVRKLLNEGTAPGRRRRTFGSDRNKARSAVKDAVQTVRNKLRSRLPLLFDHFEESLHTGTECFYKPAHPIDWMTGGG